MEWWLADYLTVEEASAITGVHKGCLYWRLQHGLIPYKRGRAPGQRGGQDRYWISRVDVEKIVRGHLSTGNPFRVPTRTTFGKALRYIRTKKGYDQHDIAQLCGVCNGQVSKWELGKTVPDCRHLYLIGAALGLSDQDRLTLYDLAGKTKRASRKSTVGRNRDA